MSQKKVASNQAQLVGVTDPHRRSSDCGTSSHTARCKFNPALCDTPNLPPLTSGIRQIKLGVLVLSRLSSKFSGKPLFKIVARKSTVGKQRHDIVIGYRQSSREFANVELNCAEETAFQLRCWLCGHSAKIGITEICEKTKAVNINRPARTT